MATIELPSGHTAEIMDPEHLTTAVKLAVQRAVQMEVNGKKIVMSLALTEEMKIAALSKLIQSWSLPSVVSVQNIEGLAIKDYNALCDGIKEHMKLLRTSPDKSDAEED
jgi:hypothetical protein